MRPKSNIEKGKRFENWIANEVELAGFGKAGREIGSGSGKKKGDISWSIDRIPEAKNQKSIPKGFLGIIDQAKRQAEMGSSNKKWMTIIRDPRFPEFQEVYVTLPFHDWLDLEKRNKEPKIKAPDREAKWHIKSLIDSAKRVLKDLEG